MFRRYWVSLAAIGLVLVVLTPLAVVGFTSLQNYQAETRGEQDHYTANHAEDAREQRETHCRVVAPSLSIICVQEQTESGTEDGRAIADLRAQQDMAVWSYGMLLVGAGGLIVTTIGVIYVALTLMATRDTVAVTREIGRAQTRGYISIKSGRFQTHNDVVWVSLELGNTGQTPIMDCDVTLSLFVVRDDIHEDASYYLGHKIADIVLAEASEVYGAIDRDAPIKRQMHFKDYRSDGVKSDWFKRQWKICGVIRELDVFGVSQTFEFTAIPSEDSESRDGDGMGYRRVGSLSIIEIKNRKIENKRR